MNTLLLMLLVGSVIRQFNWLYAAIMVAAVGAYAISECGAARLAWRMRNALRLALVTLIVFLIVVAPTLLDIAQRHATVPYRYIHDGAIQTEEATKFLLAGKNPFVESYASTPMAGYEFSIFEVASNPALEHNPYLPFTFLFPIPFYLLAYLFIGWFDLRFVHLLLFLCLWWLLPSLTSDDEKKLRLAIAFGLNPLFVPFFEEGRNDIVVLFWLVLALLALQRNRPVLSAFAFGLSMTVKQSAWLIAPFYLLYLWSVSLAGQWNARTRRVLLALMFPSLVFVLPFAVWNFGAFVDDALLFQSTQFPVWGYGLSEILLGVGVVASRTAPFPFWLLQLGIGVPLLIGLLRAQARANTLKTMLGAAALWSFVVAFLSRALLDNHMGFVVALAILAYFVEPSDR